MLSAIIAPLAGSPVLIANQFTTPIVPPVVLWIDKIHGIFGAYSRIVVNSQTIEDHFAAHPLRYRKHLVRIDHGFRERASTLSKSEARSLFGLPQDAPLLGSVGRLAPSKHYDAAVKLLTRNAGWNLALCGHGPDRDRLRAIAGSLGCAGRLHLIGEVQSEKVGDFLAALDVFVFPSLAETFGLAAVEGAQAGAPLVVNDLSVLREVLAVEDQPCALFVDVDDTDAFATAVSRLLEDDVLRERLTTVGRRLKDRYPLDSMYDAYDRMIREALADIA